MQQAASNSQIDPDNDQGINALRHQWVADVVRPLKPVFMEVIAVSLFVNILALCAPIFTLQVYDRVVSSGGLTTLQGLVIGMVLVAIFDFFLRQVRARILQTVALRVDVQVGKKLFEKLMALPLRTLETKPAAFWQLLFRDVEVVRNTLSGASAVLVADLPFAVMFFALIFVLATPLGITLMVIMPLFLALAWFSARAQQKAAKREKRTLTSRDTLLAELVSGRTTIKALALDDRMRPLWEERSANSIEEAILRGSKNDTHVNLSASLTMMTNVILTTVGALFIVAHEMTMGALIASNMLMGRLLGPLNQLVGSWKVYLSFRQSVERLGDIFAAQEELQESRIGLGRPKGELAAENVVFRYKEDAAPTLDSVNMKVAPGGITAIVGPNGSGKTTLLKVLMGLYPCESGRVLLDQADIAQFTRRELAEWMGYVPQECVLFSGSIRDNIAQGMADAGDEHILKASRMAGVHPFIIDLPDGYGTPVGEGGSVLSGGQRQRLVLARALVGDPPVLMLDEPSSNLDRKAEEDLARTLLELAKEHTIVMVTHSPVLLSVSNRVVALDKGRILAAGPSQDILPRLFARPAAPTAAAPPPTSPPAPMANVPPANPGAAP
ncbi:MAG: ATP-binding cassette domain-containing protein [Alphaproteobacteria bacterium]|nr:ATP-binding cassette domain-containing protein [Alphaproteobacteria bacterium]